MSNSHPKTKFLGKVLRPCNGRGVFSSDLAGGRGEENSLKKKKKKEEKVKLRLFHPPASLTAQSDEAKIPNPQKGGLRTYGSGK